MEKAYLVLENGQVFEGLSFGAKPSGVGELVFTTGVVGYLETLTDPGYDGQIVVQTFPLIGNYGVIDEDIGGKKCFLKGYVVREWCDTPSNFRCDYSIDKFLKEQNIPGIYGVDTREITKTIRENGVMNAAICSQIPEDLSFIKEYKITGCVKAATCEGVTSYSAIGEERYKTVVLDLGATYDIADHLTNRGCSVTVVPADTSAESILALDPDGVVLSNGGGDPLDNGEIVEEIKKLIVKTPILGIGLGHQLLALANGGKCGKLKYGHRGGNQPVKDVNGVRSYMTSQNHGYVVTDVADGKLTFVNLNDNSCEGVEYPEKKAMSVQFIPEKFKGPHDTSFIYDKFISLNCSEGEICTSCVKCYDGTIVIAIHNNIEVLCGL